MKKLERTLCIVGLCSIGIAGAGAGLETRAMVYEKDRTIERVMLYGGLGIGAGSILLASHVYSMNDKNKKKHKRL